jgi:hypothetical protein
MMWRTLVVVLAASLSAGTGCQGWLELAKSKSSQPSAENANESAGAVASLLPARVRRLTNADVETCYAKSFFRFAAANAAPSTDASFALILNALPEASRTRVTELAAAYVRSPMFTERVCQ